MNSVEEWNFLVKEFERNYNELEDKIQSLWESYFSHPFQFGYNEIGEFVSKRQLHLGSTDREIPDIILRRDEKNLVVVELKRYSLSKTENFEKQLLNYMTHTDLHLSIGILICQKLYIYWHDYAKNENEILEIPFERDNKNGVRFVELFNKRNFDENDIHNFIHEQVNASSI